MSPQLLLALKKKAEVKGLKASFHFVLILILSFCADHVSSNQIVSKTLGASLDSLCGSLHLTEATLPNPFIIRP